MRSNINSFLKLVIIALASCGITIAQAKTFYVNSTEDTDDYKCQPLKHGKDCTLREAINAANARAGHDKIKFKIPKSDPGCKIAPGDVDRICTIVVDSAGEGFLPVVTDRITIDGNIREGRKYVPGSVKKPHKYATKRPGIEIAGYLRPSDEPSGAGIKLENVSGSTVTGLIVNRFGCFNPDSTPGGCVGILNEFGSNNKIFGNYIGTDVTGTRSDCDPNVDGGCSDIDGKITFGNSIGIVAFGVKKVTIGGKKRNKRNLVSNNFDGIVAVVVDRTNVVGNLVGTNVYGEAGLGNRQEGIDVHSSSDDDPGDSFDNRIDSNVIVGSMTRSGMRVWGDVDLDEQGESAIYRTVVVHNKVGVDLHGNPGPNRSGIAVLEQARDSMIGFEMKHGKVVPKPNHIAYNIGTGIILNEQDGTPARNTMLFNKIHDNVPGSGGPTLEGLGIGFATVPPFNGEGVTPNDPKDPDVGSNRLQNFPLLKRAKKSHYSHTLKVKGSLNSVPNTYFLLEFFANSSAVTLPDTVVVTDPEETRDLFSEGEKSLGLWLVKTNAYGDVYFKALVSGKHLPKCEIDDEGYPGPSCITATATRLEHKSGHKGHHHKHHKKYDLTDTSTFSPAIVVE